MFNWKLKRWVKKGLKKGNSSSELKQQLVDKGLDSSDIDKAITDAEMNADSRGSNIGKVAKYFSVFLIVLLIAGLGYYLYNTNIYLPGNSEENIIVSDPVGEKPSVTQEFPGHIYLGNEPEQVYDLRSYFSNISHLAGKIRDPSDDVFRDVFSFDKEEIAESYGFNIEIINGTFIHLNSTDTLEGGSQNILFTALGEGGMAHNFAVRVYNHASLRISSDNQKFDVKMIDEGFNIYHEIKGGSELIYNANEGKLFIHIGDSWFYSDTDIQKIPEFISSDIDIFSYKTLKQIINFAPEGESNFSTADGEIEISTHRRLGQDFSDERFIPPDDTEMLRISSVVRE